jgi:hypothetical protein
VVMRWKKMFELRTVLSKIPGTEGAKARKAVRSEQLEKYSRISRLTKINPYGGSETE